LNMSKEGFQQQGRKNTRSIATRKSELQNLSHMSYTQSSGDNGVLGSRGKKKNQGEYSGSVQKPLNLWENLSTHNPGRRLGKSKKNEVPQREKKSSTKVGLPQGFLTQGRIFWGNQTKKRNRSNKRALGGSLVGKTIPAVQKRFPGG